MIWSAFKSMVSVKSLPMQYEESVSKYDIFSYDAGIKYECEIFKADYDEKVSGLDVNQNAVDRTDFETNYKSSCNKAFNVRAGAGRPERVASSPQPLNTTEMWKGLHLNLTEEETSGVMDIQFDSTVYLRGGCIYSGDSNPLDTVTADVVLKAQPTYVVKAGLLKDINVHPNIKIDFISAECMEFSTAVMLRVTYTKSGTGTRSVSAVADYFK